MPGGDVHGTFVEGFHEEGRARSLEVTCQHVACGDERGRGWGRVGRSEEIVDVPGWLEDVVAVESWPFYDEVGERHPP